MKVKKAECNSCNSLLNLAIIIEEIKEEFYLLSTFSELKYLLCWVFSLIKYYIFKHGIVFSV